MSYVLRMKKEAYEKALAYSEGMGSRSGLQPYLTFDGNYARGTPNESDADRFSTKKAAGEAFDASGAGRREDYECIPAEKLGGFSSYKLKFT